MLLQIYGEVDGREARPARDLHAEALLNLTGNGCHVHVSLWKDGKNLSRTGGSSACRARLPLPRRRDACGRRLRDHQSDRELFKRINAPRTLSGATWSPNTVTYTGNNRTHMVRVPDAGRFELRLPTARPTPICCRRRARGRLDGSRTARSGRARSTSTCIPKATRFRRTRKSCRSTCSTPCAPFEKDFKGLKSNALGEEFIGSRCLKLKNARVEFLRAALHRVGARQHAGLLDALLIRDPRPDDEAAWRRLWAGYVAFYEAEGQRRR